MATARPAHVAFSHSNQPPAASPHTDGHPPRQRCARASSPPRGAAAGRVWAAPGRAGADAIPGSSRLAAAHAKILRGSVHHIDQAGRGRWVCQATSQHASWLWLGECARAGCLMRPVITDWSDRVVSRQCVVNLSVTTRMARRKGSSGVSTYEALPFGDAIPCSPPARAVWGERILRGRPCKSQFFS